MRHFKLCRSMIQHGALQTLNEADLQLFEIMRNLPSNVEIEEEGEEDAG
jgi:hypothetical protein